jgi:hypothetical protein
VLVASTAFMMMAIIVTATGPSTIAVPLVLSAITFRYSVTFSAKI